MNRATWKWYYRQLRITRREAAKAHMDAMIFGTGFVRVSDDGFVNHLLPQAVYISPGSQTISTHDPVTLT
jgi:hypothetical protein